MWDLAHEMQTADDLQCETIRELISALEPFANYACDRPCGCHNCRARAVITKANGQRSA